MSSCDRNLKAPPRYHSARAAWGFGPLPGGDRASATSTDILFQRKQEDDPDPTSTK